MGVHAPAGEDLRRKVPKMAFLQTYTHAPTRPHDSHELITLADSVVRLYKLGARRGVEARCGFARFGGQDYGQSALRHLRDFTWGTSM